MKNNIERKKLLVISIHADPSMPPGVNEWGGTHTYMRELLTELCSSNFDVTFITRKVYQKELDYEDISNTCRILRLTLGDFENFSKKELYKLHNETLQQTLKKLEDIDFIPDVIHSVYWNSGHLAMKLSNLWKIPYVHSVISNGRGRNEHGATGTAVNRIETEEKVFQNASFILCVAESEKAEICQFYNIPDKKIIVAGQYVHPAFISPAHNNYGEPRKAGINYKIESSYFPDYKISKSISCDWWSKQAFTYTGRLCLDKGINFIVQAWVLLTKKYPETCPPLWIIGGNAVDIESIRPALGIEEKELTLLENNKKLVWWGYLDENGISAIYTKTLALITHSKYEPGGRVAVEAMCEGLPVLATPNGFALDTIHNWTNGFLIDFEDVSSLSIRMEHFIKQPYLSEYMGHYAKQIGKSIILKWSFIKSHTTAYLAAINNEKSYCTSSDNKELIDEIQKRELKTFPFNNIIVDAPDIIQIMTDNDITDISSVKKMEVYDASSIFWEVRTKSKAYIVKLPFDRLNFFPLWSDINEFPKVISGFSRYKTEVMATSFSEIPKIVGKSDNRHAIIREKFIAQTISEEQQLTSTIEKIHAFHKTNPISCREIMEKLNTIINKESDYKVVDFFYEQHFKSIYPNQNYFMDYSLRIELARWYHYYKNLRPFQKDKIKEIFMDSYRKAKELSNHEAKHTPVVNHGGFDYKNLIFTPEPILLDNEKIHIGWSGIDFADFLITYVQKNYTNDTVDIWKDILSYIPNTMISQEILLGWLLLSICKESVSEIVRLNRIDSRLKDRCHAFLHVSNAIQ